jgi:hypothetical protein
LVQDPEYLEKVGAGVRRWWQEHPEARERKREETEKLWKDPEYREKVLEARRLAKIFKSPHIDRDLWDFANGNGYLAKIAEGGIVTGEEIETLRDFFDEENGNGAKKRPPKSLLDRFSIALAQIA